MKTLKKHRGKIIAGLLAVMVMVGIAAYMAIPAQAAGNGKYEFVVYGSYTNFCYRLIRVSDLKVWDAEAGALAAAPTYADTDTAVTINQTLGGYAIDIDAALPAGEYDFLVYETDSPAYTDTPVLGKRLSWNGTKLLGLPQDL